LLFAPAVLVCAFAAGAEQSEAREALQGAWMFSEDGGQSFTLESLELEPRATVRIVARAAFDVDDPAEIGGLVFVPGRVPGRARFTLNGKPMRGPLRGMRYTWFALDPQEYLVEGSNGVVAAGVVSNRGKKPVNVKIDARLKLYPPEMVSIQTGPILGAIGQDFFTLTCRTNMPAEVTVVAEPVEPADAAKTEASSKRGFYHRLRVPLAEGTQEFSYTVTSRVGEAAKADGPVTVKVPGSGESFRFVAAGDSRSRPKLWSAVAAAIKKAEPELLVLTGDMVADGRWDFQWDAQFFRPARGLLTSVPVYPVIGNHEENAAAYFELLYAPGEGGKSRNWAQAVGDVLFVGIDGSGNWKPGSPNAKWLEEVLKSSDEKFIFLASHYPAWSSGPHGRGNEGATIWGRRTIMPLLAKYRATAMVAGHDHCYERSEPPAGRGVTCIVTGGAGAPIYGRDRRAAQGNPHSRVFASKLHYCVFDVKGDLCEMKVYEPNGNLIDQRTFKARDVGGAEKQEEKKAA
jgi:hypothetical protein